MVELGDVDGLSEWPSGSPRSWSAPIRSWVASDLCKVDESGLSSNHRKVLAHAAEGSPIEIIDEDQFACLAAGASGTGIAR
ncbi:MAG: hypothetical protein KTU85_11510 [Acidimicrobiia bacterium]|nr:hypothetical protein [Acidimicrobiia bacterium]